MCLRPALTCHLIVVSSVLVFVSILLKLWLRFGRSQFFGEFEKDGVGSIYLFQDLRVSEGWWILSPLIVERLQDVWVLWKRSGHQELTPVKTWRGGVCKPSYTSIKTDSVHPLPMTVYKSSSVPTTVYRTIPPVGLLFLNWPECTVNTSPTPEDGIRLIRSKIRGCRNLAMSGSQKIEHHDVLRKWDSLKFSRTSGILSFRGDDIGFTGSCTIWIQ